MAYTRVSRVLIFGDNREVAEVWAHALRQRSLQVDIYELTAEAINRCGPTTQSASLVILDANAPGSAEVALCSLLRARFTSPLLVFTFQTDERHQLQIYDAGADESVTKPLGIALFLSKVQAWLRRSASTALLTSRSVQPSFKVDVIQRRITTPDGRTTRLSRLEFRLFQLLVTNHDQVLESGLLIDRIWGLEGGDISQLKNLIYRLRQKIEPNPAEPLYIHSEPNYGYKLTGLLTKN